MVDQRRRGLPNVLFGSLRSRLLLLVALAVAPSLTVVVHSAAERRQIEAAGAVQEADRAVRVAAAAHRRVLDGSRQFLGTLAQMPGLKAQDSSCNALLADLLERNDLYANLGVVNADGDLVCSGITTEVINLADRSYVAQALATGELAIGDYRIGRITDRPSVNFGIPLFGESGGVDGVLFAALDLAWLNQLASEMRLPPGASLLVVDRTGTVLARHPGPETWIGRNASQNEVVQSILGARGRGVVEGPGLDGVRRLYSFAPLARDGEDASGFVVVGLPAEVIFRDVDRALARDGLILMSIALLSALVAWYGSELFVLRPIRSLLHATRRIHAGELHARSGIGGERGEIGELLRSFDSMADALQEADAQRDVRDNLRRANYELEQQNLSILEASRLKTEFVSMVSHESRTPLTSIKGYVELLLEEQTGPLGVEQREFLEIVRSNVDRLLALIEDVLDLSRVESGRVELSFEAVDIVEVIESVGATFRPLFDTKAQDWKVEVVGRITQVRADRGRLVQILSNLISNAHKYTPGGGRITARVRLDGAMLRVDVRDTGIGLTSEEQSGLFDRFYRVSNAATKGVPGTGLGLAITKALVEMHGGEVRVASVPGRGTTFSFTLPTMDGAAA